eukprot:CAMPEP_0196724466 /NCGR_PEP_ID=MMETSP1091-20130531/6301_1 /TAXON_ID=302021 /ORGANISM="Rhodomonas sp., Strain CCMP768" /LENGTH=66 /DNA_ID=CAMNT_0042066585 /DNA_START=22 /DNA_END=222 /DNA_ORIENTATION=+
MVFSLLHQKDDAKADPKKAQAKMGKLPGMDPGMLKLFNQAMKEQKSHGVEMHGPKMGSIKVDNDDM